MELDEGSYSGKSDEESETKSSSSVLADVDVPIPPGYWRLGVPHPKAKAILFRFATKDDKKLPGAEKRSHYYQKHGNPNYGGLKGLISSSRKRKMQAARNRQEIGKFADDFQSLQQVDKPGFGEKRKTLNTKQSKVRRMRMYADDEEEKMKKKSILHNKSGSKFRSVHSRLGTKYTYDDLINLGKKFSSESEEEEDDNISISCTVPSHNVWTDIAKEMAKESQSEGSESDDHEESRSYKKSSRYGKFDDFSPFQDSGSWKSSRGQSSQDLRSTLTSQRKEFSHNEPHEDLRSKIKRLKRDDSVSKHRSPMFRDD